MPPQSRPHDPFNDAPRRPRSQATNHLQETHNNPSQALRPTAPTSSRNLFAASLSRRPTAAASSTHVNEVLEDSDDGEDRMSRRTAATARNNRARRARAATETTVELDDEDDQVGDLVVRDERGGYLREVPAIGEQVVGAEEEQREEDARLLVIARDFWASGVGTGGRGSRRLDEDELEKPKADVMARLREAVSKKLTEDQWMYEPTDYMEELRIANHGRV